MKKVSKWIVSIMNGALIFSLWSYSLIMGSAVVQALLNTTRAMRRFSGSRGSLFDAMALNQQAHNPLGGARLDPGLGKLFLIISAVIAVIVVIKGIRAGTIRLSLSVNCKALAGAVSLCTIAHGSGLWLLKNDSSGILTTFVVGCLIFICLSFASRFFIEGNLKETAQPVLQKIQ